MRQYYKSDIIRLSKPIESYKSFVVYFLILEEEIVYVGCTGYLFSRLKAHSKTKKFERYFTISCETQEEAFELETHYIKTLKPILNKVHNSENVKENKRFSPKLDVDLIIYKKQSISDNYKPVVETNMFFKLPNNSYEKKYLNHRFVWIFNIEGKIYSGDYYENETYIYKDILIKPRKNKGVF